jgi:hypothetical protein
MPNANKRESTTKSLVQRYEEQHVGGAYDAKAITKGGKHAPIENSAQSARHTTAGFKTAMGDQQTELNEAKGTTSLESSLYIKGFTNVKYGDIVNAKGKQ